MSRQSIGAIGVCAGVLLAGGASPTALGQSAELPGWRLVWSDEFSGTSVNSSRWNFENVAWPYNGELQYYSQQNATAQSGVLNIRAERRTVGNRNYVSARINTDNKFEQQYGRFEARMKVPYGQGFWPAFWLLPATNAWPPEIDIMEILGHQTSTVYMTQHWGTVDNVMSYGGNWTGPDFSAGFHRFAVEWSPSRVDWFVDGVLRFTTTSNFPHEPMYVVLNLAVGGFWPGNPTPSTVFPQSLLVDWVRVYQREAVLANPSFETTSAGVVSSWQLFGNAQSSTTAPTEGARSIRAFGVSGAGPHYSGAFQNLPASPGQVWQAAAHLRHLSTDPLAGSSFVDLKIEWYNRTNQLISTALVTGLTSASPTNTTIPVSVQATAPAGAASARIAVVYAQPSAGSGSVYFDQVNFGYLSPAPISVCLSDFNGSGISDIQDIFDFLNSWFASAPLADFNESQTITIQDIFDFLNRWFQGCP